VFEGQVQWPNEAIRQDEVFSLRRQQFGDFEISALNRSEDYLTRVFPDWRTHIYARVRKRHDLVQEGSRFQYR